MKKILFIILTSFITMATYSQQVDSSLHILHDSDFYTDLREASSHFNQLVEAGRLNDLYALLSSLHTTVKDSAFFWQQAIESRKMFPYCSFIDRTMTFGNAGDGTNSVIINYRYVYRNPKSGEELSYSVYYTFEPKFLQTRNLSIVFIKAKVKGEK